MAIFNEGYVNEFLGIRFEKGTSRQPAQDKIDKNPEFKKKLNEISNAYKDAIRKAFKNDKILKDCPAKPRMVTVKKGKRVINYGTEYLFEIKWEEICKECKVDSGNYYRDHNEALRIYKDDSNANKAFEKCKNEIKSIKSLLKSVEESISDEYKKNVTLDFLVTVNPDDDEEYASWDDEYVIGYGEILITVKQNESV